ncbi:uncharacterized protein L203_105119 [Cryptococcus depauperatus CBS 7841]|uniref:Cupin type-2 domain-containing protein n=1 Tax=Cryptococcus depauperatus CBS 7841 TaxID=1295531 RepID=A0AAJ8JX08_9TREE
MKYKRIPTLLFIGYLQVQDSDVFTRSFATTIPTLSEMSPQHKMAHFPRITTSLPSEHAEFRTVLWTGKSSQLVLMTVPVGGEIGKEVHHVDQHLVFTSGTARAIVGDEEKQVKAGDLVVVPQGTQHNFINSGPTPLSLFTVYAPAEHAETTVSKTKEEGDKLEEEGKDEPPEWARK